jgi:hypothetical protein
VLSVVAIGTPIGYFVFKRFKRDPSGNTSNTGTIEMDEDGYLAPTNPNIGTIETTIFPVGIEGLNSYPDLHLQVAILLSGVYEKTDELIE